MNTEPCPQCGSTLIEVEATFQEQEDGHWVGDQITSLICQDCRIERTLSPAMMIALMHHLIERREAGEGTVLDGPPA
jgi:hypothetical protein